MFSCATLSVFSLAVINISTNTEKIRTLSVDKNYPVKLLVFLTFYIHMQHQITPWIVN